MSNFRFGADDYKLSYYPPEASDGIGGVDWDKVESVEIEFDEYVKIVRCRDCKFKDEPWNCAAPYYVEPNGFCAWGERANFATCECGEDIEVGNRESAVCPRCNRTVIA